MIKLWPDDTAGRRPTKLDDATGTSTRESSRATACSAVQFLHDRAKETHKQQMQIIRKNTYLAIAPSSFCFSSYSYFEPSFEPLDGCVDGTFQPGLVSRLRNFPSLPFVIVEWYKMQ